MKEDQFTDNRILSDLLMMDLGRLSLEIGMAPETGQLDKTLATKSLNLAERLSRENTIEDSKKALLICALVWEHRAQSWDNLDQFLLQILTRIGLLPSATMLRKPHESKQILFPNTSSILTKLQISGEILNHQVYIGKTGMIVLSAAQMSIWDSIDRCKRLGISAPTSAGKTFVLLHKVLDLLNQELGIAVIILPTIALIGQVLISLKTAIAKYNLEGFQVLPTYSLELNLASKRIYVLTQERAISALVTDPNAFTNARIVVIDEIQNIERAVSSEDEWTLEDRADDLLQFIHSIEGKIEPQKIVISGPGITNIEQLTKELLGEVAESISIVEPPVVSMTYSFSPEGKDRTKISQYNSCTDAVNSITMPNVSNSLGKMFQKQSYAKETFEFFASLISSMQLKGGTIVFSPTKKQAQRSAIDIGKLLKNKAVGDTESIEKYISDSIHPLYSQMECIKSGTGYHHSGVPSDVRFVVEHAFSDGLLSSIFCTSTLLQGINLPAKNLIARNPYLFTKNDSRRPLHKLTAYEFSNLKGRAGRLMEDFVGRTFILDGNAFEKESIYITNDVKKEIGATYSHRFEASKQQILQIVRNGTAVDKLEGDEARESNRGLVTYLRSVAKSAPDSARERFEKLGIKLSTDEIGALVESMNSLSVSNRVCELNPHWDPVILDRLYQKYLLQKSIKPEWEIPRTPFDENRFDNLINAITLVQSAANSYFQKFLGTSYQPFPPIRRFVGLGLDWAGEKLTSEILAQVVEKGIGAAEIDYNIELLNQIIPYGLPKLLKPLVSIDDESNPILAAFELGAIYPLTRSLVTAGLARDPSVRLSNLLYGQGISKTTPDHRSHLDEISDLVRLMNYWDRIQIEAFILTAKNND